MDSIAIENKITPINDEEEFDRDARTLDPDVMSSLPQLDSGSPKQESLNKSTNRGRRRSNFGFLSS